MFTRALSISVSLLFVSNAFAKEIVPEDLAAVATSTTSKKASGWSVKLNLGATGSLNHSSDVVGTEDGLTMTFGIVVDNEVLFVSGQHEWETITKIQHAQTKTPSIDKFIKSIDNLELKSTYLYHLRTPPWAGPFGRLKLSTQIFNGYAIRSEAVTVRRVARDGVARLTAADPQTAIKLTSAFEPLTLRETAGVFANPFEEKVFTLKTKLGAAAQHIITRDGYVVSDDDATPELDLKQLETTHEVGAELDIEVTGEVVPEMLSWKANANFFHPVVTSAETELDGIKKMNIELGAGISLKLTKWLSLDYVLTAKRVPLVLDEFQVQNGLLLTAGFNII